jgi:recombination associated protein RdgC
MFKHATIYRFTGGLHTLPLFVPTRPTQVHSMGLVPPQVGGPLVDQGVANVVIEQRSVPGAQLDKRVAEFAAIVERETGRKPGKAQRRELKDQALMELLPRAFPRQTKVPVALLGDLLVLGTSSATRADEVTTLLAQCGLSIAPLQTEMSPATLIHGWLHDGAPDWDEFDLGDACSLKGEGPDSKAVRYKNADLTVPEVKAHLLAGLRPTELALCWGRGVTFTLTDAGVLKGLDLAQPFTGEFDGDVVMFKAQMTALLRDLIGALS